MSKIQTPELSLECSYPISISVTEPVFDEQGKFTTYSVKGNDKLGGFQIRRRYNDFYCLREALKKKWPGIYIPPIPSKSITVLNLITKGGKSAIFVEERRRQLGYFVEQVASIKFMYYCELFQTFLRIKTDNFEKTCDMWPRDNTAEIIAIYKKLFGHFEGKQSINDSKAKVVAFCEYLKKSEKELKVLKEEIKEVANAKREFSDSLNTCNIALMPEYEKNVFKNYVEQAEGAFLFHNNEETETKIKSLQEFTFYNSFDLLVDLISGQLKEVIALREAIEYIFQTEANERKLEQTKNDNQQELSKLRLGKTTFKSIFTKGSKPEQIKSLQRTIQENEIEIKHLRVLSELLTTVMAEYEIPTFKQIKQQKYYRYLNKVSRIELKHLHLYGAFLKAALIFNQNLKFQ